MGEFQAHSLHCCRRGLFIVLIPIAGGSFSSAHRKNSIPRFSYFYLFFFFTPLYPIGVFEPLSFIVFSEEAFFRAKNMPNSRRANCLQGKCCDEPSREGKIIIRHGVYRHQTLELTRFLEQNRTSGFSVFFFLLSSLIISFKSQDFPKIFLFVFI